MRDWLDEIDTVLRYSRMTWVLIILGVVTYFGILSLGYVILGSKTPTGPFAQMFEPVYEMVGRRYDKLAFVGLISFWIASFRRFRKDRKRLLHM